MDLKGRRSSGLESTECAWKFGCKIADYLSVVADAAARLELRDWSSVDGSTTFSNLSTLRPNEYPLTISSNVLGLEPDAKGVPFSDQVFANRTTCWLIWNMEGSLRKDM